MQHDEAPRNSDALVTSSFLLLAMHLFLIASAQLELYKALLPHDCLGVLYSSRVTKYSALQN